MRACTHTRTRAGVAIFVQSGAEGALKMCVRVRAYNTFLVRTCADVRGRAPHVRTSIFFQLNLYFSNKENFKKKILKNFLKIFWKNCVGAGACAGAKIGVRVCVRRTLQFLCDVRAGAGQKVRTLKVWSFT